MKERRHTERPARIFLLLLLPVALLFASLDDKAFPSWWFAELSIVAGLAAFGLCLWLSVVIDSWLRRD